MSIHLRRKAHLYESCNYARHKAVLLRCFPQVLGRQVQQTFPTCFLGCCWAFPPSFRNYCAAQGGSVIFYTFKSLSVIPGSKYSIIQSKLFVNSQKIKLFMNKFDIMCDIVLSILIPCELVSNRIFVMHTLPLLSMVEINGQPLLTEAGECAFRLSSGVSHKRADAASNYF